MKKAFAGLLVGGAFFVSTHVQALDLMHAYEAALNNDPIYRSAVKENEAGQANRVIGRSQLLPKLSYNYWTAANNLKQTGAAYTGGPQQTTNQAYPSDNQAAQLTQPIFDLGALARYRQGVAQGDYADAKFAYQSQDLLVRTLQLYTDVLFAEDQLRYQTAERDAYHEQMKVNQRMFDKGEGTRTDLLESTASYSLAESKVIEAQNNLEVAKRKLEAMTGESLKSVKEVKTLNDNFKIQPVIPRVFDDWKEVALGSNPELLSMKHQVEIARQNYQQNKAAHYPTVSGFATWNQQKSYTVVTIGQTTLQSMVGVSVNVPIFSGGETVGRTSQARAGLEKAQADYDATRDRILTDLKQQFDTINSSARRVEALMRAVSSSSELTRAMRKSIQGGVRINLDALIADKSYAVAQRDLAQAKYNYLLAVLKLKQQAGILTVEDMQRTAAYFHLDTGRTGYN